jgi:hypothetical protein
MNYCEKDEEDDAVNENSNTFQVLSVVQRHLHGYISSILKTNLKISLFYGFQIIS